MDFSAPPTASRASFFTRLRDGRLPHHLATTEHDPFRQMSNSPSSALSAAFSPSYASPISPHAHAPRRHLVHRSYDPRQWTPIGESSTSSTTPPAMHPDEVSGMEGMCIYFECLVLVWREGKPILQCTTADTRSSESAVSSTTIPFSKIRIHLSKRDSGSAADEYPSNYISLSSSRDAVCARFNSTCSSY